MQPPTIPHDAAQRLRVALGDIQGAVCAATDIPEKTKWSLVQSVSEMGFRLVDELEGVTR